MNCKEKRISIVILTLLVLILGFFLSSYLSYSYIFADDTKQRLVFDFNDGQILFQNLKNLFITPFNGIFIASFFDRLFGIFIPLWFNVHPSDFKSEYFCYIEAVFIISFVLILNSLLVKKFGYLYNLSFIFTVLLLFKFIQQQPYMLFVYDGFFRMLLPAFLWVGLFCMLLKNTNTFKSYFILYLLAFLCCISNELICICTFLGLFIYFIFSLHSFKSAKNIFIFAAAIIAAITGIFILFKTGAFIRKSTGVIFNLQYFIEIFNLLPEYIPYYAKYVFINHITGYVLLISQIIILKITYPKDEDIIKTIKLILSFLSGVLIFFFMLIGLNKTHYSGNFWVIHADLHVIYNIILCTFNYALLNHIIKNKLTGKFVLQTVLLLIIVHNCTSLYNFLYSIILCFLFFLLYNSIIEKENVKKYAACLALTVIALIFAYSNYNLYKKFLKKEIIPARLETYKAEKIIRLANLKNKTAFLDKNIIKKSKQLNFYSLLNGIKHSNNHVFDKEDILYNDSYYILFLNLFEEENKLTNGFIFTGIETVNKEFKENGGIFTEDELKNIKFGRLKDENFILNKH